MSYDLNTFKSEILKKNIINIFKKEIELVSDKAKNNNKITQEEIIKAIHLTASRKSFNNFYKKTVLSISQNLKLKGDFYVQKRPSFRVYMPGKIGTSFHTDYWYGHGKNVKTIWVPINKYFLGGGVYFFFEKNYYQKSLKLLKKSINETNSISYFENKIKVLAKEILIDPGNYICFDSRMPHGSPINSSSRIRLSFDFRMFQNPKNIGSKDFDNYYYVKKNIFYDQDIDNQKINWLKYINGGSGISTLSQHLLINNFVTSKSLKCYEQEAEIEILDFPMLKSYLSGMAKTKKIGGILIFSKTILSEKMLTYLKKNRGFNLKILFVAENEIYTI